MKSARRLFADMTAMLEDLHMLVVEGQSPDATPDMHRVLIVSLRDGLGSVAAMIAAVERRIDRKPT